MKDTFNAYEEMLDVLKKWSIKTQQ